MRNNIKLLSGLLISLFALTLFLNCINAEELSVQCSKNSDCDFLSGYIGEQYCVNNDIYKDKNIFSCINPDSSESKCVSSIVSEPLYQCEDSYGNWGENYCKNGNVYHKRIVTNSECVLFNNIAGCENTMSVQESLVQECLYGCLNGACITPDIICQENSDCGTDSFIGTPECYENNLFSYFQTFTCLNPGTVESECESSDEFRLFSDCGESYCEEYSQNYCNGENLYKSRKCHNKGCSLGSCFNDITTEKTLVKECEYGCLNSSCINPQVTCYKNSDCGENGYTGDKFCKNGDVYRDYIEYSCLYPGEPESYCISETNSKLIKECHYGCKDGKCKDYIPDKNDGFDEINETEAEIYFKYSGVSNYSIMNLSQKTQKLKTEELIKKTQSGIPLIILLLILISILFILTIWLYARKRK